MPLAQLTNIEKHFGERVLFDHLNLLINYNERLGFIGANGAGKSTLFKVLTGEVPIENGEVSVPSGTKIGYLRQDPSFEPGNTVLDEAELAFAELHDLAHRMRELEHDMGVAEGDALERVMERYNTLQHEFDLGGGYVWHHKLEATLLGVGLARDAWEQKVETLSGGQRSRLALAKILIAEPDILLLDEPTNHLDLAAVEWLESYLLAFKGAAVIISHDRYLLDRLATRIVWLHNSKIDSYPGNYSSFVEQRDLHELTQQRQYERQRADIDKQAEYIRRFKAGQRARQAKGREKRLDSLLASDRVIQRVDSKKAIHLSLSADLRAGDQVLSATNLAKAYDTKILWKDLSFHLRRGDRVGIIGPNGAGKTTLLRALLGEEDADDGVVRWGASLKLGYYDQRLGEDDFDPDATVYEEALGSREVKEQQVRDVLGMLLFRGDDADKPVGLLSGGERARVRLAQLLLDKPNVMLLDEPTNHLDIPSCQALEAALKTFDGTILCVSHDRYFLDHCVNRLIVLDPPGFRDFEGNYSAWAAKIREQQRQAAEDDRRKSAKPQAQKKPAAPAPERKPQPADKPKKDNPYARPFGKLSVPDIEKEIAKAEKELAKCAVASGDPQVYRDPTKAAKVRADHDALTTRLEQLEAEYFLRGQ